MSTSADVASSVSLYGQLTACLAKALNKRFTNLRIEIKGSVAPSVRTAVESLEPKLSRIFEGSSPSTIVGSLWNVAGLPIALSDLRAVIYWLESANKSDPHFYALETLIRDAPKGKVATDFNSYCEGVTAHIQSHKRERAKPAGEQHAKIIDMAQRGASDNEIAEELVEDVKNVCKVIYNARKSGINIPGRKRGRKKK